MLVFIAALQRELSHLEPLLRSQHRARVRGCLLSQGTVSDLPVVLVQSGMGRDRALEGVRAVMESCRPEAVVSIGFAGGVSPEVRCGDLVLGERLYTLDPEAVARNDVSLPDSGLSSDSALLEAATQLLQDQGIPTHRGDLLTVPKGLGPTLKRRVGTRFPVKAVDMESYWTGQAVAAEGIPFLAVRAVSDEMDDPLPDYPRFLDEMGGIHPLKASLYFLTRPRQLLAAPKLAGGARRASANLGTFAALLLSKNRGAAAQRSHERGASA